MTQFFSFRKDYPTTPPDPKTAPEIINLAKSINAGTSANHASKASWYEVMKGLAEQDRRDTETEQQAFARFIQTEDGRELFRAHKSANGPDFQVASGGAPITVLKADSAYAKLKKAAAELRESDPELTEGAAFLKIFTDPANRELAARAKSESAFA